MEQELPIWPPQAPLSSWIGRVLVAPFVRWDVHHYAQIASRGYRPDDGSAQFHPLYPILASLLVRFGVHPVVALLAVRSVASVLLVLALFRTAQGKMRYTDAEFAVVSYVLSPFSVALMLPYPEGLFLLLTVLALDWALRGDWLAAGIAGALATLTRQQGLFLVIPLAYLAWQRWRALSRADGSTTGILPSLLALAAIPVAYAGFVCYRAVALRDVYVGLGGTQSLVYSLLVSPSAHKVVPVQSFVWPWVALFRAVEKLFVQPDLDLVVNLVGGVVFVVLLALSWRHQSTTHRLYSMSIVLASFAYYTGPVHPYMGLLRHLSLAFPVFMGLTYVPWSRKRRLLYLTLSVVGQAFLLLLFGLEVWVL